MACHSAREILALEACRSATAVECMAHRWYLVPGEGERPDILLAPRFANVPPLRLPVPDQSTHQHVYVTCLAAYEWICHIRIAYPGHPPVTLKHPVLNSYPPKVPRDGPEARTVWTAYALTVPAGTPSIEISKIEEAESCLVAVEFRPTEELTLPCRRPEPHRKPVVAAIVDAWSILVPGLQSCDSQVLRDFYGQMAAMGFTYFVSQVYAGRAGWSDTARPYRGTPFGHRGRANFREPGYALLDSVERIQEDIDCVHAAGMKMAASFRINNEWLCDWARAYYRNPDDVLELASAFSVAHPELWMTKKDGSPYGCGLDFAYPEVRDYRLAVIREWCDKLERFDAVCVDVYRHPPMVSYPESLVREFERRTGVDVRAVEPRDAETTLPEWLAFRAQPFTEWLRSVRSFLRARYGDSVRLWARVASTFGRALQDATDLRAWLDEGLVDQLHLIHRQGREPSLDADSRPLIEAAHARGVEVIHNLESCHELVFGDEDLSGLRAKLEEWRCWGSDGFSFYEAERVGWDGRYLRLLPKIVSSWAR